MLNFNRKKAVLLFALASLVASLLLVGFDSITTALPQDDLIYLHGPSLTPIHMHGPSLTPIHMHVPFVIDQTDPWYIVWHELYPTYCEYWNFTSWHDNGNFILDPSDQIDMTNTRTNETRWFHVDRITWTMRLWSDVYEEEIYVEYKGPYVPITDPRSTLWHEVWPVYHGVTGFPYHITGWSDNQNGYLDFCDYIEFEAWPGIWWHVEELGTDLILNEKIMDPIGIEWHELYPNYCNWHNLTSWKEHAEDPFQGRLSPGDQIDMYNYTSRETKWYYVDRVTFTMRISNVSDPRQEWYIEYKGPFHTMYDVKTTVINSTWHEVWPFYSQSVNITGWLDNCNGVLDYCDEIELHALYADLYFGWWHVEELSIDIILNEKIDDPTGIIWNELYPECSANDYETLDWEDNGDGLLNPCDNITLALIPTGPTEKYHVENMTLTLNITIEDMTGQPPFTIYQRIYIEYLAAIYFGWEWMYYPKTHPLDTDWEVVCPTTQFGYPLTIEDWYDNCNGVLSYCDMLVIYTPDGQLFVHVDEVAVDITVKKYVEEPPPPPPWYKKPPYPDYAPSGMPDFDQKQDRWGPAQGQWTWCGPTAAGNSLWWFDSKYDPSNIVPTFPGSPDDHHVKNVGPLIANLSWWMDTDDQRAPFDGHTGTFWQDMEWGIKQYLIQQGITTLEVHNKTLPDFPWIEREIEICQDVVLLLEFWFEVEPALWIKLTDPYDFPGGDGGHYVTCAGVNSTTSELLFSDPFLDAAEQGWPGEVLPLPPPHPAQHPSLHNDTQYVSHDAYFIVPWAMGSPYGAPAWEVAMYLQQQGYPPEYHTFIAAAVVTSPKAGLADVAVTNVTSAKTVICQGSFGNVTVTVENQGGTAETFNVTLYGNATTIGEKTVSLGIGSSTDVIFTWNATSFSKGNYTLTAVADIVPGETDIADNTYIDSWVIISMLGDITGPDGWPDGACNMRDVGLVAKYFGIFVPPAPANCDVVYDGKIDMKDVGTVARYFGQTDP